MSPMVHAAWVLGLCGQRHRAEEHGQWLRAKCCRLIDLLLRLVQHRIETVQTSCSAGFGIGRKHVSAVLGAKQCGSLLQLLGKSLQIYMVPAFSEDTSQASQFSVFLCMHFARPNIVDAISVSTLCVLCRLQDPTVGIGRNKVILLPE